MAENVETSSGSEEHSFSTFLTELYTNPINLVLLAVCLFLLYKIIFQKKASPKLRVEPELAPLKKQDFTLEQLKAYDGRGEDQRVLIAVNGKVFDVTRGRRFYGPGAPYGVFAGRDASRGLATFSLTEDVLKDDHDDLSDLNSMQMDSVKEWEIQFTEKYVYVGKLLKPGEQPTEYSDTEEDSSSAQEKSKND